MFCKIKGKTHLCIKEYLCCILKTKYVVEEKIHYQKLNNGVVVVKHVPAVVLLFDSTSSELLMVASYMPVSKCIMCAYSVL